MNITLGFFNPSNKPKEARYDNPVSRDCHGPSPEDRMIENWAKNGTRPDAGALLDRDLLHIPQDGRAQIDDIGRRAGDFVYQPAVVVLAATQTGLRPAEDLAT